MEATSEPSEEGDGGEQYMVNCETDTGREDNLACPVGEDVKCGRGWLYTETCSICRGLVSGMIISVSL